MPVTAPVPEGVVVGVGRLVPDEEGLTVGRAVLVAVIVPLCVEEAEDV